MTKKKIPELEYFTIIGKFKDGKIREFVLKEDTNRAILNIIVMIEGKISVFETPIEGITLTKNKKP